MEPTPAAAMPKGLILLCHRGYLPIEENSILAALPAPLLALPRQTILLDASGDTEFARFNHDWQGAGEQLHLDFRETVMPVLDAHPEYRVAYFGTVPISLATQLGYLLGTWRPVSVFQHHHVRKDWKWEKSLAKDGAVRVFLSGMPGETSPARGAVVIRVSTSHRIEPSLTRKVVEHPLAEIDIWTETIDEDVFATPEDLDRVAAKFKEAIDTAQKLYPHLEAIHLFAACPVGLAMLLGNQVGSRIHSPVHTYEFDSKTDPKYTPSLILQADSRPVFVLGETESRDSDSERMLWAEELGKIQAFGKTMSDGGSRDWLSDVLHPRLRDRFLGPWLSLARLGSLKSLCQSRVDMSARQAPGGFRLEGNNTWILGDELLVSILRRIPIESDRRRAARLFFFHEGLHESQTLTASTSPEIGRLPKVLEEIDYRADVWSFLYERRLTLHSNPDVDVDFPGFLQDIIKIAMEVMFSFDAGRLPLSRMQTRRVSRYLIWAWQYLRAGAFPEDDVVWSILAEKPLIELAGPKILTIRERVFFNLNPRYGTMPEVGLYHENRLFRSGQGYAAPLGELIEGFRMLDGERLRGALRGVFEQAAGRG